MSCKALVYNAAPKLFIPDVLRPFVIVQVKPIEPLLMQQWIKQNTGIDGFGRFNLTDDAEMPGDTERVYDISVQQVYITNNPVPSEN